MLSKRGALCNNSNTLQAIIIEETTEKRRNSARTNIGKKIFNLIKKHFPNGNPLHKIFSKSTLKVSNSCMMDKASIIPSHNRTLLNTDVGLEYACNCRSRN